MKYFDIINRIIINDEGGWKFTNHPHDAGGMTFAGVTYKTYRQIMGAGSIAPEDFAIHAKAAETDPAHPFRNTVRFIYNTILTAADIDVIPEAIQPAYASCVIVFGEDDAVIALQKTCNELIGSSDGYLKVDGNFGPMTKAAVLRLTELNFHNHRLRLVYCHHWANQHIEKTIANTQAWFRHYKNNAARPSGEFITTLRGWLNRVERYRNPPG